VPLPINFVDRPFGNEVTCRGQSPLPKGKVTSSQSNGSYKLNLKKKIKNNIWPLKNQYLEKK
jgi:hypothetical protein